MDFQSIIKYFKMNPVDPLREANWFFFANNVNWSVIDDFSEWKHILRVTPFSKFWRSEFSFGFRRQKNYLPQFSSQPPRGPVFRIAKNLTSDLVIRGEETISSTKYRQNGFKKNLYFAISPFNTNVWWKYTGCQANTNQMHVFNNCIIYSN